MRSDLGRKVGERDLSGNIQGFLIDLDGVLYTGTTAVPGAKEALQELDRKRYPYRFISNSTRKCRSSIAEKLGEMGILVDPSLIITPAAAAAQLLKKKGKQSCILLSTGDVHKDFQKEGINTDDAGADTVVVADAGDAFTYTILTSAFRRVLSGAELMALEKDRYWMGSEGLMLSAGPFVAALEFASGKQSLLVGKPAKDFFLQGVQEMRLDPSTTAMIGDDITSDIGGAQACGMWGILTRTGKYREEDMQSSSPVPDFVIDSIAALPAYL
jgi:HAD superfamily hydrolase (TIGR01458 family)